MRFLIIAFLCSGLLGACQSRQARHELEGVAEQFLMAATMGDTTSLAKLSEDSLPVQRVMYMRQTEPTLLTAAARLLEWRDGVIEADSAKTFFVFPHQGREEELAIGFIRIGAAWRVYYIGLLSR